jgi:hypothetical protein
MGGNSVRAFNNSWVYQRKRFFQENYDIDVMKLITLVRHIPGVKNVKSLFLVDENGNNRNWCISATKISTVRIALR